ncbi:MAG: hypothetical protein ACRDSF_29445, partial [Pseudonocardiaceae bacterium]
MTRLSRRAVVSVPVGRALSSFGDVTHRQVTHPPNRALFWDGLAPVLGACQQDNGTRTRSGVADRGTPAQENVTVRVWVVEQMSEEDRDLLMLLGSVGIRVGEIV